MHLHSSASLTTRQWFSEYFGAPESYADPLTQYALCKSRGMTLVTLTDHDSIEGGLKLIDRPDFFLSVEVSTRFPENDCAVHVLVYNLSPAQHERLQSLRHSVYEVSAYLRRECLAHVLPHPMLSPNWRLDAETLEKCLALFPAFEAVNGLLDSRNEADMAHLFASATPELLSALATKHGIDRAGDAPGLVFTAGSDDHGHRRAGSVYTEVEGTLTAADFLRKVMAGNARVAGRSGDLNAMAMCINQTAYEYFRRKGEQARGRRNPLVDVMDVLAGRQPALGAGSPRGSSTFLESLVQIAQRARLPESPELDVAYTPPQPCDQSDRRFVDALNQVSDSLAGTAAAELGNAALAFDLYGAFAALTDLAGAIAIASPVLFAADHFARQDDQIRRVWKHWTASAPPSRHETLAVFSDSLGGIDGVAKWCGRFARQAQTAGQRVWFASCGPPTNPSAAGCSTAPIPAVKRIKLPLYRNVEIIVPSLPATVDRVWRERITHVELATPGPMGLAGLVAARLLRLPVTASFHTDFAALIETLTGVPTAADLTRAYLGWFYRSAERVFAFSPASRDALIGMGVEPAKIELAEVAVDPHDFCPAKVSRTAFTDCGIEVGNDPVVLTVGRLSPEKNVALIIEAVERLQTRWRAPKLIVVGDGPARSALEADSRGRDFVHFVGFQQGAALRRLYASADVFVFASTIDTLGMVNLEALASGVPVLVPAKSAIAGLLRDGENALFYDPNSESLALTLGGLFDDPAASLRLVDGGRRLALERWQGAAFDRIWQAMVGSPESRRVA